MKDTKMIFSVLAVNHPGVLLRLTGLISRRGFNIDSLVACDTENPAFSRITLVVTGDEAIFTQLVRKLLKSECVVKVEALDIHSCAYSELLLVKVRADDRIGLLHAAQAAGARVLDIGESTLTLELSGPSDSIDQFLARVGPFGIVEMARTGISALRRGDDPILLSD